MKSIEILSREDIKKIIKKVVDARTEYLEEIINKLNRKIDDLNQVVEG